MPLENVGDLPRPRRNSGEDLVPMLEELEASPGDWFKVDEDPVDLERMHKQRSRIIQTLRKRRVEGFEFTVQEGVLYGRRSNDDGTH